MKKIIGNSGAKKPPEETSKQKAARILQKNTVDNSESLSPSQPSESPCDIVNVIANDNIDHSND